MSANYAFFIPEDEAFNAYYIDPASLGHQKPEVLHFYYNEKKNLQYVATDIIMMLLLEP